LWIHCRGSDPSGSIGIVHIDTAAYSVVPISDGLTPEDTQRVAMQLRHYNPESKIVVVQGPDSFEMDPHVYDSVVESWSGPLAFLAAVQQLISGRANLRHSQE
jgi:hypothetical protein